MVAVPTFCIVRGHGNGGYGPIESDSTAIRRTLKLSSGTKILLVSVAKDPPLERFWRFAEEYDVGPALKELDITAITTPNFSLFSDVPRSHAIWNFARMFRMIEYLSSSGISVIPHINAMTDWDWEFWKSIMTEHKNIHYLVKEFQTGGRNKNFAIKAIEGLANLRQEVGRDFHIIAVGGGQYAPLFKKYFSNITLVDSTPFIKTHKREKLVWNNGTRPRWIKNRTLQDESLHDLLQHNIDSFRLWHDKRFEQLAVEAPGLVPKIPMSVDSEQNEFFFVH